MLKGTTERRKGNVVRDLGFLSVNIYQMVKRRMRNIPLGMFWKVRRIVPMVRMV